MEIGREFGRIYPSSVEKKLNQGGQKHLKLDLYAQLYLQYVQEYQVQFHYPEFHPEHSGIFRWNNDFCSILRKLIGCPSIKSKSFPVAKVFWQGTCFT
jgi:hypothetical protein